MLRGALFPAHRPTDALQKLAVAGASALQALADPTRGDAVAALGEATGAWALAALRDRLRADARGQRLLAERPRVRAASLDLPALRALPADSLGAAYARFLETHAFHPDERALVRFVDDEELAYVMQRYREVHDFWHVLFGLPPTVQGEIALKWVELEQTRLPSCALAALVGPLRLSARERRQLRAEMLPWAVRAGRRADFLLAAPYEDLLGEPLADVREELRVEPWAAELYDSVGPAAARQSA